MKTNIVAGLVLFCGLGFASGTAFGQLPGGGTGTGGTGFPTTGQTGQTVQSQNQGNFGNQGGQGGQGNQTRSNQFQPIDPRSAVQLPPQTDFRNQGFVGATSSRIQQLGFVGAAGPRSGPPLSQGQSFGGSAGGGGATGGRSTGGNAGGFGGGLTGGTSNRGLTNSTAGNRAGGTNTFGGNRQGQFGGSQFGGSQFGGNQFGGGQGQTGRNGFQVPRAGLRGQVTPNFASTATTGDQVSQQFSTSFSRLPENQNFGGQYQVNVSGKKAVVTGWVNEQSESDRLIAQLRLQPGIYEVENKLEVRGKE